MFYLHKTDARIPSSSTEGNSAMVYFTLVYNSYSLRPVYICSLIAQDVNSRPVYTAIHSEYEFSVWIRSAISRRWASVM